MGVSLRCASGRATPHYADAWCYADAPHCLTACSVSLTQVVFQRFTLFLCIDLLYLVQC
ncbi:MAG: hypothetical protein NZ455_01015 [Bacteroidia bacterium]|nr:hypothetical protein [Bacteroidia bacterium]MDW8346573.1 hypothetical protein [Bacteroidia bacterium]